MYEHAPLILSAVIGLLISEISIYYFEVDLPEVYFYIFLFLIPLFIFTILILIKSYLGYDLLTGFVNNFPKSFTKNIIQKIVGLIVGLFLSKIIHLND